MKSIEAGIMTLSPPTPCGPGASHHALALIPASNKTPGVRHSTILSISPEIDKSALMCTLAGRWHVVRDINARLHLVAGGDGGGARVKSLNSFLIA